MFKAGDKVRILENKAGTAILHHFPIGDVVEVVDVCGENSVVAIGYCDNSNEGLEQLLVNTENLKQFEKV